MTPLIAIVLALALSQVALLVYLIVERRSPGDGSLIKGRIYVMQSKDVAAFAASMAGSVQAYAQAVGTAAVQAALIQGAAGGAAALADEQQNHADDVAALQQAFTAATTVPPGSPAAGVTVSVGDPGNLAGGNLAGSGSASVTTGPTAAVTE